MAALRVPIRLTESRGAPQLSISYAGGGDNGIVGLGFGLDVASIVRRTANGVPRYNTDDVFLSASGSVLVPRYDDREGRWIADERSEVLDGITYAIVGYRPEHVEHFDRIERWTDVASGLSHWRTIDPSNTTVRYGIDDESRIADPMIRAAFSVG